MRRTFIPSGGSVGKIVCHSIPPNTGWAQLAFLWQIRAFLWALSWSGFCYLFLHKTLIFFVFESHRQRISTKTCCNYDLWNSHHGFLRGYFKKIFSKFAKVCRSKSVSLRNSFECNCLKLLVSKYNEHYAYLSCYAIEWNNGPATLLYGFRAKISWYELSNNVLGS